MTRRRPRGPADVLVVLAGIAAGIGDVRSVQAQEATLVQPAQAQPELTLAQAFQRTKQTGEPTVVVITSISDPGSQELWRSVQGLRLNSPRPSVQFVKMEAESHARELQSFGISRAPAIVLINRDGQALKVAGQHCGAMDARFVEGWLALFTPKTVSRPGDDSGVVQAGYEYPTPQVQPSPQNPPTPPPVAKPQPQPQPPAYCPPPPPMVPVYAPPQPTPTVITPPQQPIYVQPAAPMVVVGPAPQPMVAYAAPAPAPAPPAGAPNLLAPPVAAPAPAPAPAPQPMYAPAPVYAPAPTYAPAPAPAPYPGLAAGPAPILTNPNLFDRFLGTLGEALAERRNPRIRMSTSPAYAPAAYAAAPAPAPAYGYLAAPPPGYYAPPPGYECEQPEYRREKHVRPSPQSLPYPPPPRKGGFFSFLHD